MDWIERLKKIMNEQGVNIEQLKTKIEQNGNSLSRNSIGNILNERNSPKIDTLQMIADALGVDLKEFFSFSDSGSDDSIDGFIEFKGEIRRIKSKNDLKQLLQRMEDSEEEEPEKVETENSVLNFNETLVRSYITRSVVKSSNNSVKLTRHVLRKYNITICDKKEFFEIPNELKRDTKIWIFSSKDDSQKAKLELRRHFNFQFNE